MIEIKRGDINLTVAEVDEDSVNLVALGDLHVGAETFDETTLKRVVQFICDTKALVIGAGDWIENGTKTSVGAGVYLQKMPPKKQIEKVVELLSPIPKDQWLGAVIGNHEIRTLKDSGIDLMSVICLQLEIPYSGNTFCGIVSRPRDVAYSIYLTHSRSTGKMKGLEEAMIERDWERFLNFDIIGKAHGHYADLSEPKPYLTVDFASRAVVEKERYFWLTGGFLKWAGSYAADVPYRPHVVGTVALNLSFKHGKKVVNKIILR